MPSLTRCNRFNRFFLAILLLAAGCAKVGPDFVKPEAAVMPEWLEAGSYKQVSTKAEDYRDWWRSFNDPVLDRLIQTAYRQNLPLQIAGVRVLGARAQLGAAVGELYPQSQKVEGSVTQNRISRTSSLSGPGSPVNYWSSQIGLTASWEIDFWGKFRRAVESADASLLAAVADYDNTLVSLTGDVANSYIQLRTLEKRLAIAHQNVEVQKKSLQIAMARWQGGTTSKRDVEQAQTVLDSTEASIPSLESQVRQTQNALSVLLGMPPSDLGEILGSKSDIPAPPPQVAIGIPADLLRRRPDVRRAERQAAAQSARIGMAEAEFYPHLAITGTISFDAQQFGDLFDWRSIGGKLGPGLQWNILNYGRIRNHVRVEDARFQSSGDCHGRWSSEGIFEEVPKGGSNPNYLQIASA